MSWDPGRYLRFSDFRLRPGLDLLNRVEGESPGLVVDLGCGPGHLTRFLARRWPDAELVAVDSSAVMLARAARALPDVRCVQADLTVWEPPGPVDVLFSNAALHWVDRHESVFTRLHSMLSPGGQLAVQMPANWAEPTHRLPAAPVLDALDPTLRLRFSEEIAAAYRQAYPPEPDGTTILPFTRLFIVGRKP